MTAGTALPAVSRKTKNPRFIKVLGSFDAAVDCAPLNKRLKRAVTFSQSNSGLRRNSFSTSESRSFP
jgi:hypothetical protein